jgi:thiamine biosynthesis lipoprotein
MKQTKLIMGMPIGIEIVDDVDEDILEDIFDYFTKIDNRYSTYKADSEISRINGGLPIDQADREVQKVLQLCEQTKQATDGYFDIVHNRQIDPSGLVKGWAIHQAAKRLLKQGAKNFYIEAGGDIQVHGHNAENQPWSVGIRNPFNGDEIIKTVVVGSEGVATSGTYVRGQHIYNPLQADLPIEEVKSLTVIGPNIYEADRFATAAFAMGEAGINFIESRGGLEGYMVDAHGMATFTSGFARYVTHA